MVRRRTYFDECFFAPFVAIITAAYISYILLDPLWHAFETFDWPKTRGVVIGSSVRQLNLGLVSLYAPQIVYMYEVRRDHYVANNFLRSFLPSYLSFSKEAAAQWSQTYPQGKFIEVYYADDDPANAVIEPGVDESHYLALICAAFILGGGGQFFYKRARAYRKYLRQRQRDRFQVVYR